MREFDGGATRDGEDGKYDYEGFLSPIVLAEFARYMHANRVQKDGSLRDSDNWQKGIPTDVYAKSLVRHMMDFWLQHRGALVMRPESPGEAENLIDTLCAIMFNTMGYLYELLEEAPPNLDWDGGTIFDEVVKQTVDSYMPAKTYEQKLEDVGLAAMDTKWHTLEQVEWQWNEEDKKRMRDERADRVSQMTWEERLAENRKHLT